MENEKKREGINRRLYAKAKEAVKDPYFKELARKRAERLQKTREKLAKEPMPENKPKEESKEEFIKRTNPMHIRMLKDKRIMRAKALMDKKKGK